MKKRLVAVVAVMSALCMMLTGCAKLAPADQTISALFDLYVKEDAAPMMDLLGFESEEAVNKAFFEEDAEADMVAELQAEFAAAGMEMSEEEVQELTDTMVGMMNKTSCTAEITAEDGDYTTVTLQVTGFSNEEMMTIIEEASNAMLESITEEDLLLIAEGDMDVLGSYMSAYVEDFMSGFAAMETVAEPVEVTVECEKLIVDNNGKEITAWLPSDMDEFTADIDAAVFQN